MGSDNPTPPDWKKGWKEKEKGRGERSRQRFRQADSLIACHLPTPPLPLSYNSSLPSLTARKACYRGEVGLVPNGLRESGGEAIYQHYSWGLICLLNKCWLPSLFHPICGPLQGYFFSGSAGREEKGRVSRSAIYPSSPSSSQRVSGPVWTEKASWGERPV